MRRSFRSRCVAIELLAMAVLAASPIAAQARINRVIGGPTGVIVLRAGLSREGPATVGDSVLPGDLLRAADTSAVELQCSTGGTLYRVKGPFRVLIDVPVAKLCHVDLLAGHVNVIAEEPSHTTGGTIALASKGTEYSVDVTREGGILVCKVVVFEGAVFARQSDRTVVEGTKIQWTGRQVTTGVRNAADIERSAAVYAAFDLAAARSASPEAASPTTYAQLKALHYAVLANPVDTAKRVELAKRQIAYKVNDQAAYNLKRANVRSDTALRRYQIDPKTVRETPAIRDRIYRDVSKPAASSETAATTPTGTATTTVNSAAVRAATVTGAATTTTATGRRATGLAGARSGAATTVRPAPTTAPPAPTPATADTVAAPVRPTADRDLRLIAAGQIDAAIQDLDGRVAAGIATSRDHYALAKAYDTRDAVKVRENASRAMSLHVKDGMLSEAELEEVREFLGREE